MDIQLFNYTSSQPSIFQSGYIEGAKLIGADKFGEQGRYGEGVKVAIIDTGCDISHPDLKDRIIDVRNFTDDDKGAINNVTDYATHGTATASIIASSGKIIGVAPKCNLLILKALTRTGGKISWVTEAIKYATQQNVDIINMSLGCPQPNAEMYEAIKRAIDRNIIVVAASGNNGDNNPNTNELNYPASFNECVSVGSVRYSKGTSRFSASNNEVDLVAFGEGYNGRGILTCYPNNLYKEQRGTSFSAPFVSGALALLKNWFRDEFKREPTESELYGQLIKRTMDLNLNKNIQGNGILYLSLEDVTDKLVFNEELIKEILNR